MPEYGFWMVIGFLGQTLFTGRFIVQWLASERKGDSVIPVAFWWLSLVVGVILLSYAIAKRDPVFVTGQAIGICVYVRNLTLLCATNRSLGSPLEGTHRGGRPGGVSSCIQGEKPGVAA